MTKDAWNPTQYLKFEKERSQPFYDLLDLVESKPGMEAVDLGCGNGVLTLALHARIQARSTVGIDSSPAMLDKNPRGDTRGLSFVEADIQEFREQGVYDLVFSNAALQWVDDHTELFERLRNALKPGGQFAIQVPANHDHLSHLTAARIATESPYVEALQGYRRGVSVLSPENYTLLLHKLGFREQKVQLQVYLHELESRAEVIEWVKGTLLTDYEKRLTPDVFQQFLARYREALFQVLEDSRPYPYTFKRIRIWARR